MQYQNRNQEQINIGEIAYNKEIAIQTSLTNCLTLSLSME